MRRGEAGGQIEKSFFRCSRDECLACTLLCISIWVNESGPRQITVFLSPYIESSLAVSQHPRRTTQLAAYHFCIVQHFFFVRPHHLLNFHTFFSRCLKKYIVKMLKKKTMSGFRPLKNADRSSASFSQFFANFFSRGDSNKTSLIHLT